MSKFRSIGHLASTIAKREGKKSQARIGDIREILGVLSDLFHESMNAGDGCEDGNITSLLDSNGAKRAARKKPQELRVPGWLNCSVMSKGNTNASRAPTTE